VNPAGALQQTQVRTATIVCAMMMANQVAAKATRDGIFLSQFTSSALPTMVVVAAVAGIVLSALRARQLVRFGPFRITAVSFAVSGILQCVEWALLPYYPRAVACGLYLHVVAFGAILLSGFWSVMNEAFDPRAAKTIFARIGGFGTLGGLCGGLLAERIAAWSSSAAVVLLLAILHLACAALLWRTFPPTGAAARTVAHSGGSTVLDAVHRYPFLIGLASLVLAASVGASLLDFVFKAQAVQTLGRGAPLVRFFGLFYTATSLMIFLVQTLVTRFTIRQAGLAPSAAVLPAVTAAGSLAAVFFPGLNLVSAVRGTETLLRGSIYRSAYELFYTAVAPAEKRAVKSVIDVGVERMGDAAGAGIVSLLLIVAPGRYGAILAAASACSVVAFLVALRLRPGYLHALEKSLINRAVEIDPAIAEDSLTRSLLMRSLVAEGPPFGPPAAAVTPREKPAAPADFFIRRASELRSGELQRAIDALEELGPEDWTVAPLVIELLAWDPAMPAARAALQRMGPAITGMLVDVLLDPGRDFAIRRRVPRVLSFVPTMRTVEGLFAALEDHRFEVRFYSGRALHLLLSDNPALTLAPERIWDAINRELSQQRSVWQSHRLLDSRDAANKEWFFDDELLDRADRNLEHLFTLLALLLPVDAVRIAFRALHTEDRQLKGTAFEYLESATPAETRQLLLPLLEADAQSRLRSADGALANLLHSRVKVDERLKQALHPMVVRR
jgi:hypothetical protein